MKNNKYDDCINESVQALCDVLEKYHPGVTKKTYEHGGSQNWTIFHRMRIALYLELIFAGIIK